MFLEKIKRLLDLGPCLNCGHLSVLDSGFCSFCDTEIFFQSRQEAPRFEPFLCRSLYKWQACSSELFSLWVRDLKEAPQRVWNHLAAEFWIRLQINEKTPSAGNLVSLQSRDPRRDHAQKWGRALQRVSGLRHQPILRHKDQNTTSQKSKSRAERGLTELVCTEKYSSFLEDQIIFVDDVLTTGSTARAAYEILGRPKKFEVWTVLDRPRLPRRP